MTQDVIDQLKQIIAQELDVNLGAEEIDEDASLFEEGIGLDSMAIMDFILLIEGHFGFEFSESELDVELFRNLRVLADFISTKVYSSGFSPSGAA
jgi:acyl carrier protein